MPPSSSSPSRVIRVVYSNTEYNIFLTEDNKVEFCLHYISRNVGTRIFWSQLPWAVRDIVEQQLDPHDL